MRRKSWRAKSITTLKEQAAFTARLILPNDGRGLVTYYLDAAMCELGYEIQGTVVKSAKAPPWGPVMRRGYEITDVRTSLDRLLEE